MRLKAKMERKKKVRLNRKGKERKIEPAKADYSASKAA